MSGSRKSRRTWALAVTLIGVSPLLVAATSPGPGSNAQSLSTPASVNAVGGAKSNRGGNGHGRWSSKPPKPPKLTTTTTTPTTTTTTTPTTTTTSTTTTTTSTTTTTTPTTTTTTPTTTTTTSTTTTTILTSTCLDGSGPLVTLSGTLSTAYYNQGLPAGTCIDARAVAFLASPTLRYPINLDGGDGCGIVGGAVLGQYDRTWTWDQMHTINNAGIAFNNSAFTIDGLRVDNVEDGIRPQPGTGFTVRNAWLSYVRDDCVENDHVQPGLIDDSLFDGCYVALSERPSPAIAASGWDGRGQLVTVQNSLIRLQPMPGPRNGLPTDLGNGEFFKWSDVATNLELDNNVFMAEQVSQDGADQMGVPSTLVSCSNNVMVWLGNGPYPAPLPACFTVTTDRSVWDAAVANWLARHGFTTP